MSRTQKYLLLMKDIKVLPVFASYVVPSDHRFHDEFSLLSCVLSHFVIPCCPLHVSCFELENNKKIVFIVLHECSLLLTNIQLLKKTIGYLKIFTNG